jgi:hypothetical protein
MKKCPYCAEEIQDEAIVCRFCGRELTMAAVSKSTADDLLTKTIADYQAKGWILLSNQGGTAQLKKPKQFEWGCFILGILVLLVVGILYLIYYAVQSEEVVTLTIGADGFLAVNGKSTKPAGTKTQTPEELAKSKRDTKLMFAGLVVIIVIVVLIAAWPNIQHSIQLWQLTH